ncbi:MAG TPA: amidohydrolase family protein [Candidatus Saccharimonadales bacterium]|jgi:imidazolonepropionase-like amidohydrolase|nr:amidohydrolase family protein [Candidatus Saccharimonadales bacterium]
MKSSFTLFVSLLLLTACALAAPAQPALVIHHVNIIDTAGGPVQPDMSVLIQGDRIARIGKTARMKIPAGAQIMDAHGKFLVPGLWDMHVHVIFGDWIPGGKEVSLPLFVANGVTGVRDMGGDLDTLLQWRKEISTGTLIGPRMVIAGPMLDGPKSRFPSSLSIASPEEGRKAVDDLKAKGVDFIKVQSFIQHDAYLAVADECKKQKLTLAGHVPDAVRAAETVAAGQKSIEHLTGVFEGCSTAEDEFLKGPKGPKRFLDTYDQERCSALIAKFARHHTWQVPTLVWERGQWLIDDIDYSRDPQLKYAPQSWQKKSWPAFTKGILSDLATDEVSARRRFVKKELEVIGAMQRAGVPLLAGTDTAAGVDVLPGFSLHTEMEYMVEAGLSPMEALQTATLNPAKFLGLQKDLGSVTQGKLANLVLLDANPLQDIRNTRKISAVVLNGRLLDRAELDKILEKIAEFAAGH